jgi:hypothetical protein
MPEETKPDSHILDLQVMDAAIARGRRLRSKAYYDFVRRVGHGVARAVRTLFNHGTLCPTK